MLRKELAVAIATRPVPLPCVNPDHGFKIRIFSFMRNTLLLGARLPPEPRQERPREGLSGLGDPIPFRVPHNSMPTIPQGCHERDVHVCRGRKPTGIARMSRPQIPINRCDCAKRLIIDAPRVTRSSARLCDAVTIEMLIQAMNKAPGLNSFLHAGGPRQPAA
jgi:hypothetical protein